MIQRQLYRSAPLLLRSLRQCGGTPLMISGGSSSTHNSLSRPHQRIVRSTPVVDAPMQRRFNNSTKPTLNNSIQKDPAPNVVKTRREMAAIVALAIAIVWSNWYIYQRGSRAEAEEANSQVISAQPYERPTFESAANDLVHFGESLIQQIGSHILHHSDKPLQDLFYEYSNGKEVLTAAEFLNFLHNEQKEYNRTIEDSERLIAKFSSGQQPAGSAATVLPLAGFMRYLYSQEENAAFESDRRVYHDMDQPLSHYFISSSHNTYLLGHQFKGMSSEMAYKKALLQGCRCIEIDCWDSGIKDDDEPIVYHGYTWTSRIKFKDVLETVREYAFAATDYPLIISLEVHCSLPQQQKMYKHINEILGDLLAPPIQSDEHPAKVLPSPESMKRKIFLQGQMAKVRKPTDPVSDKHRDILLEEFQVDQNYLTSRHLKNAHRIHKLLAMPEESEESIPVVNTPVNDDSDSAPTLVGQWYKDLYDTIHLRAIPYQNPDIVLAQHMPYDMYNMNENFAWKKIKKHREAFLRYNEARLTRIYPKGSRLFSSNYNPVYYWRHGCQIVSLNYQAFDAIMRTHNGFFADNGQCGYILRPQFRNRDQETTTLRDLNNNVLKVNVISGRTQFPTEKLQGPGAVSILMEGLDWEGAANTVKTFRARPLIFHEEEEAASDADGDNMALATKTAAMPIQKYKLVWSPTFEFRVKGPVGSAISIGVFKRSQNYKFDNCLAYRGFPFASVKQGYRYLQLKDPDGAVVGGLICKFSTASSRR